MKKRKKFNLLTFSTVSIAVMLVIIWGNSLLPGGQSGELSDGVTKMIAELLGIKVESLGHFVRKAAHFTEFALLGASVFSLLTAKKLEKSRFVPWFALAMTALPLVDESIQVLIPDRGPAITDLWIDMAGFAFGAAVAWSVFRIVRKHKKSE